MASKEQYAQWCVQLVEGDDVLEELYEALMKDGFTDESGFWIYTGEEETSLDTGNK